MNSTTELILMNISGPDRRGLTTALTEILARYEATILDIGQADIHHTIALGILFKTDSSRSGEILKELLFATNAMHVQVQFNIIDPKEYEEWVDMQGKNRYIITMLGRKITAQQIARVTAIVAEQRLNIDAIRRLTGRMPLDEAEQPMAK